MKSLAAVALVLSLSALCADPAQQRKNPDKRIALRTAALAEGASAWLAALPEELRQRASQPFDSEGRKLWGYMGGSHGGVALGEQSPDERRLQDLLLREALSHTGYLKLHAIESLEEVLERDPSAYFMTVFGDPSGTDPWGFKLEGHHVSLNFTLQKDEFVSATPLFLGADPARVEKGARIGLEIFYQEEKLMRDLLGSFPDGMRRSAALRGKTPDDVLRGPDHTELFKEREGVPPGQMTGAPMGLLAKLMNQHTAVLHEELAVMSMDRYRDGDVRDLDFIWSGMGKTGEPLYYRIQSVQKGFAIEYVNRGNHVHTLWRDTAQDFGSGGLAAWEKRSSEESDDGEQR